MRPPLIIIASLTALLAIYTAGVVWMTPHFGWHIVYAGPLTALVVSILYNYIGENL